MDAELNSIEVRILGCLIEKELATPEYYPLSLNALTNACNQKSNRRPVLSVDESAVLGGLDGLLQKGLARETHMPGSRVPKYLHELFSLFDLSRRETAVLCELMLRGPQTPGELRSNSERMARFENIGDIEETLRDLMDHDPSLVAKLPREAGRKESRYVQLFSSRKGEEKAVVELHHGSDGSENTPNEAITRLEEEIAAVRRELDELRREFVQFKSQF